MPEPLSHQPTEYLGESESSEKIQGMHEKQFMDMHASLLKLGGSLSIRSESKGKIVKTIRASQEGESFFLTIETPKERESFRASLDQNGAFGLKATSAKDVFMTPTKVEENGLLIEGIEQVLARLHEVYDAALMHKRNISPELVQKALEYSQTSKKLDSLQAEIDIDNSDLV